MMKFDFQNLLQLLCLKVNSTVVVESLGSGALSPERDEFYGSIEFLEQGVEVVLKEAPWVFPTDESLNPNDLFIVGFHFHREGHDGYKEYSGQFPNKVSFRDTEEAVRNKLGGSLTTGGGSFSRIMGGVLPRWIQYQLEKTFFLRFQLDSDGKVNMVSLFVEAPSYGNKN